MSYIPCTFSEFLLILKVRASLSDASSRILFTFSGGGDRDITSLYFTPRLPLLCDGRKTELDINISQIEDTVRGNKSLRQLIHIMDTRCANCWFQTNYCLDNNLVLLPI